MLIIRARPAQVSSYGPASSSTGCPAVPVARDVGGSLALGEPGSRSAWVGYAGAPATLTIQLTPNLSTHMPNVSPHGALSSGMVTVPPSDSLSQ
jgi:hypothetical protein